MYLNTIRRGSFTETLKEIQITGPELSFSLYNDVVYQDLLLCVMPNNSLFARAMDTDFRVERYGMQL